MTSSQNTQPLRGHWWALIAAFLGWMFDGFEMGLFPLVGNSALRELMSADATGAPLPEGALSSLVNGWFSVIIAVFLVGAATGGVLFGWLGDRIGRVRALSLSILTYSLFTGACGLVGEAWHIAVLRFIASLGMGGEWALGVSLITEIWPDRSRTYLAGLIGAASNVGFLSVGLISLVLTGLLQNTEAALLASGLPSVWVATLVSNKAWRLMMIVGSLPALLVFLIRLFVPESERWQQEHRRGATSHWATVDLLGVLIGAVGAVGVIAAWSPTVEQMSRADVIRWIVTPGGLLMALLGYMYPVRRYLHRAEAAGSFTTSRSHVLKHMLLGAALASVALLGTWGTVQWLPKWVVTMTDEPFAREYVNISSAAGAIVATFLAAMMGGWLGRRITYSLLCIGSLASVILLFQFSHSYSPVFLACVFLTGGITSGFYGWFPLYLPELFPTSVRSTTQGFAFNFGRIMAAVGALQTATMLKLFNDNFAMAGTVMSGIYVIGLLVVWLGPETKGRPLPD